MEPWSQQRARESLGSQGRTRDRNVISVVTMHGVDGGRKERRRGCTQESAEQQPRHSKSSHTMCGGMAAGTEESVHNTATVSQATTQVVLC